VVTSESFSRLISEALNNDPLEKKKRTEPSMSEAEINEWLNLFNEKTDSK
jgi:hypothetical protein